jgi:glutaredoxin 3
MVTVYSADWCGFCRTTKRYLEQLNVEFEEKNVEQNPEYANEAVKKSGQMGIPVIDIAGKVIVGFNKPEIDKALKENGIVS